MHAHVYAHMIWYIWYMSIQFYPFLSIFHIHIPRNSWKLFIFMCHTYLILWQSNPSSVSKSWGATLVVGLLRPTTPRKIHEGKPKPKDQGITLLDLRSIWLVVFRLPLWKMMDLKSVGMMTFHSQLFVESHQIPWFQTTHQPSRVRTYWPTRT